MANLDLSPSDASDLEILDVACLAYERSHDFVVMKGYKFHRARVLATLALGHFSFEAPRTLLPEVEEQRRLVLSLKTMLRYGPLSVQASASAAIVDLCRSSRDFVGVLTQVGLNPEGLPLLNAHNLSFFQRLLPSKIPR